jgi:hypothetical protein
VDSPVVQTRKDRLTLGINHAGLWPSEAFDLPVSANGNDLVAPHGDGLGNGEIGIHRKNPGVLDD